jgi:hypothetical protein
MQQAHRPLAIWQHAARFSSIAVLGASRSIGARSSERTA